MVVAQVVWAVIPADISSPCLLRIVIELQTRMNVTGATFYHVLCGSHGGYVLLYLRHKTASDITSLVGIKVAA